MMTRGNQNDELRAKRTLITANREALVKAFRGDCFLLLERSLPLIIFTKKFDNAVAGG